MRTRGSPTIIGPRDVVAVSHPHLHDAFETISHDSGGRAGHFKYTVPPEWWPHVPMAEAALATLAGDGSTDSEFQVFCIGDQDEYTAIRERTPELMLAGQILDSFFEGWQEPPPGPWCPFCRKLHEGGDTCMGHHP